MKRSIIAVMVALSLAFATKSPNREWTNLACYYSAGQRDQKLAEALTAVISGPIEMTGYATYDHNGIYCFEIYTLEP